MEQQATMTVEKTEKPKEERKQTAHQAWLQNIKDIVTSTLSLENKRLSNREIKYKLMSTLIGQIGEHSTSRLRMTTDALIVKADTMQNKAKEFETAYKECPWIRFKRKRQLRRDYEYSYIAFETYKESIKVVTNTFPNN